MNKPLESVDEFAHYIVIHEKAGQLEYVKQGKKTRLFNRKSDAAQHINVVSRSWRDRYINPQIIPVRISYL